MKRSGSELRRWVLVVLAAGAVIGVVKLVEHFGKAGDVEGELAALGSEGAEGAVDPGFDPRMVWVPVLDLAATPEAGTVAGAVGEGLNGTGGGENGLMARGAEALEPYLRGFPDEAGAEPGGEAPLTGVIEVAPERAKP